MSDVPFLTSGLYVVATPIGNLQDMTYRAVSTLQGADLIACEDTRHSGKLLKHFDITTPRCSYHEHNSAARLPELLEKMQNGAAIALISDAGTPLIADPGYKLVEACHQQNIPVHPVPGASALSAALSIAGLPTDALTFIGFLPQKTKAKTERLAAYKQHSETLVCYESPTRLMATLELLPTIMGENRPVTICRELTKMHEDIRLATAAEHVHNSPPTKGEIVLVIGGAAPELYSEEMIITALEDALQTASTASAATTVAEMSGWRRREVYQLALSLKNNTPT